MTFECPPVCRDTLARRAACGWTTGRADEVRSSQKLDMQKKMM